MAWTSIIECRDRTYYVGSTIDLDRRIEEHNLGFAAKYPNPGADGLFGSCGPPS